MKPNLGMYVHMHWGYNHPYCARTWTLEDWRNYAGGIAALGYDLIMIWPMLEIIPDPPTESDLAHLDKIRQVIDLLHSEYAMKVLITLGANAVGNERARSFDFEKRPYFQSDLRLNPGDPGDIERLIRFRDGLYRYLGKADGCVIIDSDPGGYVGSTNEEFTYLLLRHLDMIRGHNPAARLFYWMWNGWEAYNKMWQDIQENKESVQIHVNSADFDSVVEGLADLPDDAWGVLSCCPIHRETVEKHGIQDRSLFLPYGLVEGEPTFPRTNCDPEGIRSGLQAYDPQVTRLGAMANSQSHIVQLPNAYLFSHFAKGGTPDAVDLAGFADGLVPCFGQQIADAWQALNSPDPAKIREARRHIDEMPDSTLATGSYSGLLFGDPQRFLRDLSLQLDWHADMREFASATEHGRDWHESMRSLISSWEKWYARTGFSEAHCSPGIGFIHEALRRVHGPGLDIVLDDLESWRDFSKRHGLVGRLLEAMRAIA